MGQLVTFEPWYVFACDSNQSELAFFRDCLESPSHILSGWQWKCNGGKNITKFVALYHPTMQLQSVFCGSSPESIYGLSVQKWRKLWGFDPSTLKLGEKFLEEFSPLWMKPNILFHHEFYRDLSWTLYTWQATARVFYSL